MFDEKIKFTENSRVKFSLDIPNPKVNEYFALFGFTPEMEKQINRDFDFKSDAIMVLVSNPNLKTCEIQGYQWNKPYIDKNCKPIYTAVKQNNGIMNLFQYAISTSLDEFHFGSKRNNLLIYSKYYGHLQLAGVMSVRKIENADYTYSTLHYSVNPYWNLGRQHDPLAKEMER